MKLSVTIVLLSIASYAFAQSTDKDSRSTKIDENEKKRLENQFKALDNFYINDDGLVVYQTQGSSASQNQDTAPADTTRNTTSAPKSVKTENTEGNYLIKNESEAAKSTATQKPLSTRVVSSEHRETEVVPQQKAPVKSSIIKKEALRPTEVVSNAGTANNSNTESGKEAATKSVAIKNSPITITDEVQKNSSSKTSTNTSPSNTDKSKTSQPRLTSSKSSVFDKNKRPSQYKTMEEAALAVEALLDDLRKEQAQTTNAGSMSSRLSGGAGRTTLRKKPATNPSYSISNNSTNNSSSYSTTTPTVMEDESSEYGTEPTYYINGKEVDKIEVNRLRKKEIINKEVRTRNTVSGNPNGEVWYEVKYDN